MLNHPRNVLQVLFEYVLMFKNSWYTISYTSILNTKKIKTPDTKVTFTQIFHTNRTTVLRNIWINSKIQTGKENILFLSFPSVSLCILAAKMSVQILTTTNSFLIDSKKVPTTFTLKIVHGWVRCWIPNTCTKHVPEQRAQVQISWKNLRKKTEKTLPTKKFGKSKRFFLRPQMKNFQKCQIQYSFDDLDFLKKWKFDTPLVWNIFYLMYDFCKFSKKKHWYFHQRGWPP